VQYVIDGTWVEKTVSIYSEDLRLLKAAKQSKQKSMDSEVTDIFEDQRNALRNQGRRSMQRSISPKQQHSQKHMKPSTSHAVDSEVTEIFVDQTKALRDQGRRSMQRTTSPHKKRATDFKERDPGGWATLTPQNPKEDYWNDTRGWGGSSD